MERLVLKVSLAEKENDLRPELLRLKGEENVDVWDGLSEFVHRSGCRRRFYCSVCDFAQGNSSGVPPCSQPLRDHTDRKISDGWRIYEGGGESQGFLLLFYITAVACGNPA